MADLRTGGCLCGAARYEINIDGNKTGNCHCIDCQKNSGSAFMPFTNVDSGQFRWVSKPEGKYASSNFAYRRFCKECGTPLTWEGNDRLEQTSVSTCTLDDTSGIQMVYEIYTRTRLEGISPVSGARQYAAGNE